MISWHEHDRDRMDWAALRRAARHSDEREAEMRKWERRWWALLAVALPWLAYVLWRELRWPI